jgi:hypothetical protein
LEDGEGVGVGVEDLLDEPVPGQATGAAVAAVEPEGELVEVVAEVLVRDTVVQGAFDPALEEGSDAVDREERPGGGLVRAGHDDGLVVVQPRPAVS